MSEFISGEEIEQKHKFVQVRGHTIEEGDEVIVRFPDGYEEPIVLHIDVYKKEVDYGHNDIMTTTFRDKVYFDVDFHGTESKVYIDQFDQLEFQFIDAKFDE